MDTHRIQECERMIKEKWSKLSASVQKDVANVWYEREQHEVEELGGLLHRLRTNEEFRQFVLHLRSLDVVDVKLERMFTKRILASWGSRRWVKQVFPLMNKFIRAIDSEIKLLEDKVCFISRAQVEDSGEIRALFQKDYSHVGNAHEGVVEKKLVKKGYIGFCARSHSGELVGFGAVKPFDTGYGDAEDNNIAEFGDVVVSSSFRGRGVAWQLMRARLSFLHSQPGDYLFAASRLLTSHNKTQRTAASFTPTCLELYSLGGGKVLAPLVCFRDIKSGFLRRSNLTVFLPYVHGRLFHDIYQSLGCRRKIKSTTQQDLLSGLHERGFGLQSTAAFLEQNRVAFFQGQYGRFVRLDQEIAPLLMFCLEQEG